MFIIDPDNPAATEGAPTDDNAAAAAAGGDGQQPQPPAEPTAEEREAAEMAVIDKALDDEPEAGAPKAADKPKDGDAAAGEGGKPEDKAGEPGKDGKPAEKKPEDGKQGEDGKPKPDADIEKEITDRKLKGDSAERFRELATKVKDFAPIKDELEKAGVKSVEDVASLLQRGQAADSMIAMVMETGATEEQYGTTLDYLTVVNRAQKGDRQAAEQAFAMISREYAELAKALGKEVPGVHDPLAEHPDLQKDLENADITRERALEIAGQRRQAALLEQARQQNEQHTAQTRASEQAITQGVEALRQWEADKLADPGYLALRPALHEEVKKIRAKFAPAQWADATELAYNALAAKAAAAANRQPEPKPRPSAMRPGAGGANLAPKKFATDLDAVDAALESL